MFYFSLIIEFMPHLLTSQILTEDKNREENEAKFVLQNHPF